MKSRQLLRKPMQVVGHRGSIATDPENTLGGFRRAETDGADGIELDVRLTADGELVVMHDADVDRTTDGTGRVRELDSDHLRRLDAGGGEPVPTLAEVLRATSRLVQIELKEEAALDPVLAVLAANPRWRARTVISSFSSETIRLAKRGLDVKVGLITRLFDAQAVRTALDAGAGVIYSSWEGLTRDSVVHARRSGLAVVAWLANDAATLRRARDLRVDGVSTDAPGHLVGLRDAE